MKAARLSLFLVCLPLLLLSGCVTLTHPEARQENSGQAIGEIGSGRIFGQTFVSPRAGLNSLTFQLRTPANNHNRLVVELYHAIDDPQPIYSVTVALTNTIRLGIPARTDDPDGQAYYLKLNADCETASVMGRGEDSYPYGQAYQDGLPIAADLGFRLTYDYGPKAMLGDLKASLPKLWLVIPLIGMLFLPGWLLLDVFRLRRYFDGGEQLALALGFSCAIIPLVILWTSTLGLRGNATGVRLVFGLLVVVAAWRFAARKRSANPASVPRVAWSWTLVCLVAIFMFTLAVRFVMSRDLAAPAWVDSVHHATITRVIVEQGRVPSTYAPYMPIESTQYHAGFHTLTAVFHWLSGLEAETDAMLILGQVLNALMILAIYLLTTTLTNDRVAGLTAALVCGLLSPMPAYYTSWGRYTQLAGLLLLPVVVALVRLLLEEDRSAIVAGAVAFGGLFLIHYRVAAYLICLLYPYIMSQVRHNQEKTWRQKAVWFWLATGFLAILITLPWTLPTVTRVFAPLAGVTGSGKIPWFDQFNWKFLTTAWGQYALALAILGLIWSIIQNWRLALTLTGWSALLLFIANLGAMRLPGANFVNTIAVTIVLFMPISVLAGYIVSQATAAWRSVVPARWHLAIYGVLILLGSGIAIPAAQALVPIMNPGTVLIQSEDRVALKWIAENIPPDEPILINNFFWGYGLYAGNDGGFWITPLTGRPTIPPPVLYGQQGQAAITRVNTICRETATRAQDAEALATYLRQNDIRYVYIGARGGSLSPAKMQASPAFIVRYTYQGTWVFQVKDATDMDRGAPSP